MDALAPDRAAALASARAAVRKEAEVDESTLKPAYLRYSGQVYEYGAAAIRSALASGLHVLVVSGGYGLLLANERIGVYEKRFVLPDWPRGLLEECICDYARGRNIRVVIAVMSATTDYARLVRRVDWSVAGLDAILVSPTAAGGGSMVKVPRAQGQAVAALVARGLHAGWRSTDGLNLTIQNLRGQ